MTTRGAPLQRWLMVALLTVSAAGCARVFGSHQFAASGLPVQEDRLRQLLAHGDAQTALSRLSGGTAMPQDEVLRALYQGVVAYLAGDYASSAHALDAAGELADDRMTKSLARSALSLISNDLVLPYEPAATERLMIPYYAALARLRLGDLTGATVEARRLALLLQRLDGEDRVDAQLRSALRYFTATVFAAAGETNDADVAYRNAVALGCSLPAPATTASADSGTVVIVLERGFVAHRVEQGLFVMLLPEEIDAISGGDGDHRAGTTALVASRILQHAATVSQYSPGQRFGTLFVPPPDHTPRKRKRKKTECTEQTVTTDSAGVQQKTRECREVEEEVDELPYLLKVAWPVYRLDAFNAGAPRVLTAQDTIAFALDASVSRAVAGDFERERALIVARTIARGAAKLALTKGAERSLEEKNEAASKLVGLLGNVGNVLLERADLRSWHLLPGAISVAHVRLPAGEHTLTVDTGGAGQPTSLGPVAVRAGAIRILPVRAF